MAKSQVRGKPAWLRSNVAPAGVALPGPLPYSMVAAALGRAACPARVAKEEIDMVEGEIRKHRRGRRDGRHPKGRQIDDAALEEVRALLGERPRRRDLLIEHLHLIQDKYGHISAAHMAALAAEMRMAQTEVDEVATFYAQFDVV